MQYVLTGFTQNLGFRVFAFEGVDQDRVRTAFTVKADLALARNYGIPMQDLPLLCRSLLDRLEIGGAAHVFTFSEEDMRTYSGQRAAAKEEAALKRKPPRRHINENAATPWRGPQV